MKRMDNYLHLRSRTRFCLGLYVGICLNAVCTSVALATVPKMALSPNMGIASSRVDGLENIPENIVLEAITIPKTLDAAAIQEAVKQMYGLGYFDNVAATIDQGSKGAVLVFHVVERPVVSKVLFEKFVHLDTDQYSVAPNNMDYKYVYDKRAKKQNADGKTALQTQIYQLLDANKAEQDSTLLEKALVDKGYNQASVSYSIQKQADGTMAVVFTAIEGAPMEVGAVHIVGLEHFSGEEIKSNFMTRPANGLEVLLLGGGLYKKELVYRDNGYLEYFYRDNGYKDVKTFPPTVLWRPQDNKVQVNFSVDEGDLFFVGNTTDEIYDKAEDAQLAESSGLSDTTSVSTDIRLKLHQGAIFKQSLWEYDQKTIKDYFANKGYAFVNVEPEETTNRATHTVDFNYRIIKGNKVYFRNLDIQGNFKTNQNIVLRNVVAKPYDLYSQAALDTTKYNLQRLGFFESVEVKTNPTADHKFMDIQIVVKEKSTGNIQASLGFSPNIGGANQAQFFASSGYNESNFLGRAYQLGFNAQVSPSPNSSNLNYGLSASFFNPAIDDSPWSGGGQIGIQKSFLPAVGFTNLNIIQESSNIGGNVGRQIYKNTVFSLGYNLSKVRITPQTPLLSLFYSQGLIETWTQSVIRNETNNFLAPTAGYSWNISSNIVYPTWTQNTDIQNFLGVPGMPQKYGQIIFNFSKYIPIPLSEEYLSNIKWQFIPAFAYPIGNEPAPYWGRFTLGNSYFMRAYSTNPLGPVKPALVSGAPAYSLAYFALGGNRMLYNTFEYYVPIIPEANLRLIQFVESGTVLDDKQNLSWDNTYHDIGMGIRWVTPMAPLRFDFAWPVNSVGNIGSPQFVFSLGSDAVGNTFGPVGAVGNSSPNLLFPSN
jgi:outer membrane protein insertion porin family